MSILTTLPWMEFAVIYILCKQYVTCLQEILIVVTILLCHSFFLASQKLLENKRLALISSGAVNIRALIIKLTIYLLGSVGLSLVFLGMVTWLLWSLDISFLILLNHRVLFLYTLRVLKAFFLV